MAWVHDRVSPRAKAATTSNTASQIGELGLDEQAMLLRAIEERTFLPVGADREVGSDF